MRKLLCWFGWHTRWNVDGQRTNGYFWRFCKDCGARQASEWKGFPTTPFPNDWRYM